MTTALDLSFLLLLFCIRLHLICEIYRQYRTSNIERLAERRARSSCDRFGNNDDLAASATATANYIGKVPLLLTGMRQRRKDSPARMHLSIPTRPDRETAIVTVDDSNDLQISRFACFDARNRRASGIPMHVRSRILIPPAVSCPRGRFQMRIHFRRHKYRNKYRRQDLLSYLDNFEYEIKEKNKERAQYTVSLLSSLSRIRKTDIYENTQYA
jgi:hypothetical protein